MNVKENPFRNLLLIAIVMILVIGAIVVVMNVARSRSSELPPKQT